MNNGPSVTRHGDGETSQALKQLTQTVQQLYDSRVPHMSRFGADVFVRGALETRTVPRQYSWHGLKRGADPAHPFVLFQYTLAGWGCYVEGETLHHIRPQMAFTAVIPSDHHYYLPAQSEGWTFFWLAVRHPYVVSRIAQRRTTSGPVFVLPPDHILMTRILHLVEGTWHATFPDTFAEEQALFDLLVEYERFAHRLRYPQPRRECLLADVRSHVLQALDRPLSVSDLAALQGMSRSHYSHYFKATTGLAPAQFVIQVRLEEAARRLLQGNLKLEAVARETGFANANHFCKVFRRHFHLSPGEFRRQMRAGIDHSGGAFSALNVHYTSRR